MAPHVNLRDHLLQFGGLGGFSKSFRLPFNIIWISVLYTIWKDMNERIFNQKIDILTSLLEKVKSHLYRLLKVCYVLFDFDSALLES